MARPAVSEFEARRILEAPKEIRQDIIWSRKSNEAWLETRVNVAGEIDGRLEMIVAINSELPSRYSFSLLLNGAHRISGLDMKGSHTNK